MITSNLAVVKRLSEVFEDDRERATSARVVIAADNRARALRSAHSGRIPGASRFYLFLSLSLSSSPCAPFYFSSTPRFLTHVIYTCGARSPFALYNARSAIRFQARELTRILRPLRFFFYFGRVFTFVMRPSVAASLSPSASLSRIVRAGYCVARARETVCTTTTAIRYVHTQACEITSRGRRVLYKREFRYGKIKYKPREGEICTSVVRKRIYYWGYV